MRRFGLRMWIGLVNEWDTLTQPDSIAELNDPVLQEWVRFRCESLAHYADDLSDYVKSLNPNVAVLMNIKGVYSWNRYWVNAVYHPLYAGHVDILAFDTGGYDARLDANTGALVSQIRSYKMARELGASCDAPLGESCWRRNTWLRLRNARARLRRSAVDAARAAPRLFSNSSAITTIVITLPRRTSRMWPCCETGHPWLTVSTRPTSPPR